MPATATSLGTSTAALAAMTEVHQLDYVKKYFQSYSGKLNTLEDVYMAILYPAAIGKPAESTLFAAAPKPIRKIQASTETTTIESPQPKSASGASEVRQRHGTPYLG